MQWADIVFRGLIGRLTDINIRANVQDPTNRQKVHTNELEKRHIAVFHYYAHEACFPKLAR